MLEGDRKAREGARVDRLLRALGLPLAAALALGGQVLLSSKDLGPLKGVAPGAVLYVLAAALALVTLAAPRGESLSDRAGGGADRERGPSLPPRLEWSLVAIIVLGGLYLRLHRVDLIPWGLNNDEAIDAIEANEIAHGRPFTTVTERGLNRETMYHYLAAVAYRNPGIVLNLLRAMPAVFDLQPKLINDEMIDRIFPLRSVAIAVGTLTILALYLFARDRFGCRVGLLAALFLAVSPWHLLYSRVGFRTILAPLFALAAVGLFLRALESGPLRLAFACGAGGAIGLGFWTYTSFRAIPLALVAFVVLRRGARGDAARPARPLLIVAGIATLGLVLVWAFSHMSPLAFLGRGAYATLPGQAAAGGSPWRAALVFGQHLFHALTMVQYFPGRYAVVQNESFIGDGVSAYYGLAGLEPETTVVAALAALGILYALTLARRHDDACALVLLCLASVSLAIGFTGPSLTRMLLNLPWLCLLAALFAWRLFDDLAALKRPFTIVAAAAAIMALAGWSAAQGYERYFLQAGRSPRAMQYFWPRQTIMGMFVRALSPGPIVYVMHSYGRETLTYLIGDRPDMHLVTDPATLDLDAIGHLPRSVTFVVEYSEYSRRFAEALRYLIMRFPQGDMTQVADGRLDPDKIIFYTFSLYKDESGQPVSSPPAAPPPAAPSPGQAPPPPS